MWENVPSPMRTQISLCFCTVWSVFIFRMKKLYILSYPECAQWRFCSDCPKVCIFAGNTCPMHVFWKAHTWWVVIRSTSLRYSLSYSTITYVSWINKKNIHHKYICLYNFDPIKPVFFTPLYVVKLGFTGVYIIFHILLKTRLWVLIRTASTRWF